MAKQAITNQEKSAEQKYIDNISDIIRAKDSEIAMRALASHLHDMINGGSRTPNVARAIDKLVEFIGEYAVSKVIKNAEILFDHRAPDQSFISSSMYASIKPEVEVKKVERFTKLFDYVVVAILGDLKPGWFVIEENTKTTLEVLSLSNRVLGKLKEAAIFSASTINGLNQTIEIIRVEEAAIGKATKDLTEISEHITKAISAVVDNALPNLSMIDVLMPVYASPNIWYGHSHIPDELKIQAFEKTTALLPALASDPEIDVNAKVDALQKLDSARNKHRLLAGLQGGFDACLMDAVSILAKNLESSPLIEKIDGLQTIFGSSLPESIRQSIVPNLQNAYAALEADNPLRALTMKGQFIFLGSNISERSKFCPDYVQALDRYPDKALVAKVAWRVTFSSSHAGSDNEAILLGVRQKAFDDVLKKHLPSAREVFLEANHDYLTAGGKRSKLVGTVAAENTKLLEAERNNILHRQQSFVGDPAAGD